MFEYICSHISDPLSNLFFRLGNVLHQFLRIHLPMTTALPAHRQITLTGGLNGDFMSLASEEREIINAVLNGDADDFRILVERYQRPIFNLMLRVTQTTMTAEDLTQDVFERAYAKLHTYNSGMRFFPWLYTIAVNAVRDYLRRNGRSSDIFQSESQTMEPPNPDKDSCVRHLDCIMEAGRVSEALDQLPLKYSEPLLLYYREGFSVKEISATLSISVSSAKVRIHRGRELLKAVIGVRHVS